MENNCLLIFQLVLWLITMVAQCELERVVYVLYSQIGVIIPIAFNKIQESMCSTIGTMK